MKTKSILLSFLLLAILSCSSDADSNNNIDEVPEFAMTAIINGDIFQANNPFGNNLFSNTNIFIYYPIEDFVLLQGRQGGVLGNTEINIWLKRSDIVVGTYQIGQETFDTPPSHFIKLIDNLNNVSELTNEGTIIITAVDTTNKIITGTFEFTTVQQIENPNIPIDVTVMDGTFRYVYEEE